MPQISAEQAAIQGLSPGHSKGIVPLRDLKPLMDAVDEILSTEASMPPGQGYPPGKDEKMAEEGLADEVALAEGDAPPAPPADLPPMPEGEGEIAAAGDDAAAALIQALGVDEETAARLVEAAAVLPETQELDTAGLVEALSRDHMLFSKLMEHGARAEGGDSAGELFSLA